MKHIPLSDCKICKELERSEYFNILAGDKLSAAANTLVGATVSYGMFENSTRCPFCGTHYKNTNDCGFMENDVSLTRVSPTSVGIELTKRDLEFLEKSLSSKDLKTKEYATECLLDYYRSTKQTEEIAKLFSHEDRDVRLRATMIGLVEKEKLQALPLYVKSILTETDSQVRRNALRYFSYNLDGIEASIPTLVKLLKDPALGIREDGADILRYYVEERGKNAVIAELEREKIILEDPEFKRLVQALRKQDSSAHE